MAEKKHFADQLENEDVLFVFRKHPIVMRKGLIICMLSILLGTLPSIIHPSMSVFFEGLGIGFLVGLVLYSPFWISWYYSVFIVTTMRFIQITQKGLFHRSVVDINLNQIQLVNYEIAGLEETLLGFGTIMIQTYMGDLIIHNVHHPAKTQQKLLGILREEGVQAVSAPFTKEETELDEETNE